jgi:hypothetical protein
VAARALFRFPESNQDLAAESSALSNGARDSPKCSKARADRSEECSQLALLETENTVGGTAILKMRMREVLRTSPFASQQIGEGELEHRGKVCSRSALDVPDSGKIAFPTSTTTKCEKSLEPSKIRAAAQVASHCGL